MKANKSLMKNEKTKNEKTGVSVKNRPSENNSPKKPDEAAAELLNTSELSLRFGIDRSVVRKRLQLALIEPHSRKANETLYLVNEELEDALVDEGNPELDAARLRKLTVEAELKELDLKVKSGEYSSVAELTETVQKIFGALHRKCVIAQPKALARKLLHVRGEGQLAQIIANEYDKIFQQLRTDFNRFLK